VSVTSAVPSLDFIEGLGLAASSDDPSLSGAAEITEVGAEPNSLDLAPNNSPETWYPSSRNLAVDPSFLLSGGLCEPSLSALFAPNIAVAVVMVAVTAEDGGAPKREVELLEEGSGGSHSVFKDVDEGRGAPQREDAVSPVEGGPPNNEAEEADGRGAVNKDPEVFVDCDDAPNHGVTALVDGRAQTPVIDITVSLKPGVLDLVPALLTTLESLNIAVGPIAVLEELEVLEVLASKLPNSPAGATVCDAVWLTGWAKRAL
jgi:hypothetical protein